MNIGRATVGLEELLIFETRVLSRAFLRTAKRIVTHDGNWQDRAGQASVCRAESTDDNGGQEMHL